MEVTRLLSRSSLGAKLKCVLCNTVPNSPKGCPPPGHCCRPPDGEREGKTAYKSPCCVSHSPTLHLQSQQLPHRCFTDPRLGVTEPSNPAQRHLGSVPRTAPSSPPHAWAQDPSYDDHKHGAVLCAIYFKIHCQAPSASKIKLLLQIMATLNI